MKKLFLLGLLALLVLPFDAGAFTFDNVKNYGGTTAYLYPATWDDLVLDFVVPNQKADQSEDRLNAITVRQGSYARDQYDYTAVKIWADGYIDGWQGWGYETLLGSATFLNGSWYLNNLDQPIPAAGLHLYVTIDIGENVANAINSRFYVPKLLDDNGNGAYDLYDQGIFVASKNNGPTDADLQNPITQTINTGFNDVFPPVAIITSPINNQSLSSITSMVVSGAAKDEGRGSQISWIKISVAKNTTDLNWVEVTNTGVNYATWNYSWQGITPGVYYLRVQARDTSGNLSEGGNPIKVTIKAPVAPAELLPNGTLIRSSDGAPVYILAGGKKSLIETLDIFNSWGYSWTKVVNTDITLYADGPKWLFHDGTLVKGSGPKVYAVSNGAKRWITSGSVFTGLGYRWDKIVVTSDAILAYHPDGANLVTTYNHPDGTLIKFQTYPAVYLLEQGIRRHIADEKTFLGLGYKWDAIITIPDWENYPAGPQIKL